MILKIYNASSNNLIHTSKSYCSKAKFGSSKHRSECLVLAEAAFNWCIERNVHPVVKQLLKTISSENYEDVKNGQENTIHMFVGRHI